MALINGQLKNAQLEILDTKPTDGEMKGRIFFDTECERLSYDDGEGCEPVPKIEDLTPIGTVIMWMSEVPPPPEYLLLNGNTMSNITYPELFAVLGYRHGGSGVGFRVPDMRGQFIRGTDRGRGKVPATNLEGLVPRGDGNNTSNVPGTSQDHAIIFHKHDYKQYYKIPQNIPTDPNCQVTGGPTLNLFAGTSHTLVEYECPTVGTDLFAPNVPNRSVFETRPCGIFTDFYIKAKSPCT